MARTKLQTPNFNLNKRGDGYYEIRYTENNVDKSRSTGTKDPNEAENARARFAVDYRKPKVGPRPTVKEICEAYMTYRAPIVANPKGLHYSYSPVIRRLGPLFADNITQSLMSDYAAERLKEPVARNGSRYGNAPVGEATVNKEMRSLRAALNWAANEGVLDRKQDYTIELSAGSTRVRWMDKEDANKLIDCCAPHLALFLRIALTTAKRRGAILALKWDGVKLDKPGHETLDFGDDVGNKKRGLTAIGGSAKLLAALKAAKDVAKSEYVIEFKGAKVKCVRTALTAACRRAGVEQISSHVLKHTAITWMVQSGTSYERIGKHTNTSKDMIESVYGHHNAAFVAEVIQAVDF